MENIKLTLFHLGIFIGIHRIISKFSLQIVNADCEFPNDKIDRFFGRIVTRECMNWALLYLSLRGASLAAISFRRMNSYTFIIQMIVGLAGIAVKLLI